MPVDPITAAAAGPDWNISLGESGGLDGPTAVDDSALVEGPSSTGGGEGFGDLLANQIDGLQGLQDEAAVQSQALATGTAEDASTVVMAVERAQLAMQLAAQLRDKSVESFQEIFRTQV
jgi:flagellar hook-basal body complex protein FliE